MMCRAIWMPHPFPVAQIKSSGSKSRGDPQDRPGYFYLAWLFLLRVWACWGLIYVRVQKTVFIFSAANQDDFCIFW